MATTAPDLTAVVAQIRSLRSPSLATLIAPKLAVTGSEAVKGVSEVELTSPRWPPPVVPATVISRDAKREFAVLRLGLGIPLIKPERLAAGPPSAGSSWTSPALPGLGFEGHQGRVGDFVRVHGRRFLELTVETSSAPIRIGAPVIVNGQIAAIVTLVNGANVYATTLETMAASTRAPEVGDLLPLDEADLFRRLSPSALEALSIAVVLSRDSHKRVHMEHLLVGLYAKPDGPTRKLVDESALGGLQRLREILREAVEADVPEIPRSAPTLTAMPQLSDHVREALRLARNIARGQGFGDRVRSRHLLYGALSMDNCSAIKPLIEAGLRKERINLESTGRGLKFGIAGYKSDAVAGPDLLGIARDVKSLCMVLAAKEVDPPLSLGLFGEWGSGKSFFMRAMEDWFKALARDPENQGPQSPYCRRIVQLKFNAWHYSDTNLWATLASAILQGLAEVLDEKDDPDSHYERASLETQKVRKKTELDTAEQQAAKLQADLRVADERLGRLSDGQTTAAAARETLRAAAQTPELKQKLEDASAEAGIPAAAAAAGQLQRDLLEAKGLWDALVAIGSGAGPQRRRQMFVLSVVSIALVLAAIVVFPWAVDRGLATVFAAVTPMLAAASEGLRRLVAPARRALTLVEQVRKQAEVALENERNQLQIRVDAAEQNANATRTAIQQIDAQLEALRPDRRMRDFIQQRAVSPDYLAQLGTISHARRDFEQLTVLLAKVKDMAENGGGSGEPLLPQIDRIILYIDDLDRCPEDKVVQVLQAVHMLLAFNLFIVVVGVDPRWLLHSLSQHSKAFQASAEADDEPGLETERERVQWRSTPLNYLEKIFQIPFTLQPMGEAGFNNLIDDLTKKGDSGGHERSTPDDGAGSSRMKEKEPKGGTPRNETLNEKSTQGADESHGRQAAQPSPAPAPAPPVATGAAAAIRIPMDPQLLRFEPFERECMKQLRELIPSPRAAKRFVNVYRLLRNRLAEEPWSDLLEDEARGPYRAVLVLFAMLMGYPEAASQVLGALLNGHLPDETGDVDRTFWDVIDELERRNTVDPQVDPDGAERWKELAGKLRRVRSLVPADCGSFDLYPYAAAVARYSFQSGRLLFDVDAPEAED